MKNQRIIIIAMDQPLDSDAHLRRKMANAEKRAQRQSPRFPDFDLHATQKEVIQNLLKGPLLFQGRYIGLPELMNFLKNNTLIELFKIYASLCLLYHKTILHFLMRIPKNS